jgi:tetratricopeptide (TPR) repeat protein
MTAVLLCAALTATGKPVAAEPGATEEFQDALRAALGKMRSRDWPEAAAAWSKVVQMNPTVGGYWQSLGMSSYGAREYQKAIAAFEKAIELRAGLPWSSAYNIARCHALLGGKEQAVKALQRAFDMGWRDLDQPRLDPAFDSLKDDPRFKDLLGIVDVRTLTRDDGWRYDLRFLARG